MIAFDKACRELGIDPSHIPPLHDVPVPVPEANPYLPPAAPITDQEWNLLREAIPYRYGRLPDDNDRAFLDAMRALARFSDSKLNWTLLHPRYGTQNAVRMKWLRWIEDSKFSALCKRARDASMSEPLLIDLRQLASFERAYTERIAARRSDRVLCKQKNHAGSEPHV